MFIDMAWRLSTGLGNITVAVANIGHVTYSIDPVGYIHEGLVYKFMLWSYWGWFPSTLLGF